MKNIKQIIAVLLMLATLLCLAACGGGSKDCKEHKDENGDKNCDICNAEMKDNGDDDGGVTASDFVLVENGVAKVQIVVDINANNLNVHSKCQKIQELLAEEGIELEIVNDKSNNVKDYEILVGDIETRGEEYHYDYRALGPNGRAVIIKDKKVIIAGGNENSLLKAISDFTEDVFEDADDLKNITIEADNTKHCYVKYHDKNSYAWSSATIAGNDAGEYVIAAPIKEKIDSSSVYKNVAESLQNNLYEKAGKWLPIIDTSDGDAEIPEKAIVIAFDEAVKADGGFKISMNGDQLLITTYYPAKLAACVDKFVNPYLLEDKFEVKSSVNATQDLRYIYYEDEEFGAVGNGRTNDYEAMKKAHIYANKHDHIVKATPGSDYYIGATNGSDPIPIKTDVIWTGATITIDDSQILPSDKTKDYAKSIFVVQSDYKSIYHNSESELVKDIVADGGIKTTTTNLPYAPGYPALLIPYDTSHKVYIRYGGNQNEGNDQHEVILIDKDGNVDKDTPFLLDYNNLSHIVEYRVDDKPITIDGGLLVTIANRAPTAYTYYSRNISINRSNVTVKNMSRKVLKEGDTGAPYSGFIGPANLNNLLVENCTFQAHRYYLNTSGTGGRTQMGTYEIGGSNANNLVYKNCRQTNFTNYKSTDVNFNNIWYDIETGETGIRNDGTGKAAGIWGLMGSNYCKNITYDGSWLNRFDAHAGLYNASIINGSQTMDINLIGGGTALISDTTVYSDSVLTLREDYGSTWHGDIVFDNVTLVAESTAPRLITATWANWDFGYETYLPNIIVNNFKLAGKGSGWVYLFNEFSKEDFLADMVMKDCKHYIEGWESEADDAPVPNINKPHLPEYVKITNTPDVKFAVTQNINSYLYDRIEITYPEE